MEEIIVENIGTWASWGLPNKNHYCQLIKYKDKNILIDPAVSNIENVSLILVSSTDNDHIRYLEHYLKNKIQVYTIESIANRLKRLFPKYSSLINGITSPLKIDGLQIIFLAVPEAVGNPACGFKFEKGKVDITIIPEISEFGKQEIQYAKDSYLFIGLGNYDKGNHKITFKKFLEVIKELNPKSIYITNKRKELMEHKDEILKELKYYKVKILEDGDIIKFEIAKMFHIPYNAEQMTNEQLMDDWRLVIAHYANIKNKKKSPYTIEQLEDIAIQILSEIKKRVDEGKMNWSISEDRSEIYNEFIERIRNKISIDELLEKSLKPKYYSTAKPYYRGFYHKIIEELKAIGWDKEQMLIDTKFDGLRLSAGKINGKGFAFVDPETLKKKSPDVSKRLPKIIKELEEQLPDNTVLDCEFIAVDRKNNEALHRTVANSLLNSKQLTPEELSEYATIAVFDVLYYDGIAVKDMPLHERLEYLARIKETDNMIVEKITKNLNEDADGYIVSIENIEIAIKKLFEGNKNRPKFIGEGVMIKLLNYPYESPQNKGWMKVKELYEWDARILDKKNVKGQEKVWNYLLGVDISKEYYDVLVSMTTKDWYDSVGILDLKNKQFYRGKESIGKDGIPVMVIGKSDNTKEDCEIGEIVRFISEEVLKYENELMSEYPRYGAYISVFLEKVPEKNKSDTLEVLDILSSLQPKRIPIEILKRIKAKSYNIKEFIANGKIPDDIYQKLAKPNQPLPKAFYNNYREGYAWAQMHIRGIEKEKYEKYMKNEITFEEMILGDSIHVDLRIKFSDAFVQWVLTQNEIPDYLDTLLGKNDKRTGNVSKALAIVKPSAEEPVEKAKKEQELIIDKEGAKLIASLINHKKSYFIEPGDVGATAYTYSYMGLIWEGECKTGVQREDMHEYFFYSNSDILNGRFICRCFEDKKERMWWFWKARDDPMPLDPIYHCDTGYLYPIPPSKVKKLGREQYVEESKKKYLENL